MNGKIALRVRVTPKQPKIGRFARRPLCALVIGSVFATEIAIAADADDATQMMVSGRGHGVLFDGEARKQANVPDGIAEAIWKMQGQLTEWR